jgi:16S rRNA (guanine966-N2)-methyltransferase
LGTVRIIAGTLRGRRIRVPEGAGVRPTGDRGREALFSILGGRVEGSRIVDAFSGSGALGFEALSRGAARVDFVESDRAVVRLLRENAEALGVVDRAGFHNGDAVRWIREAAGPASRDLVLADPPWNSDAGSLFLTALDAAGVLAPAGWLVMERRARGEGAWLELDTLVRFRTARYGNTAFDFYRQPS